MLSLETCLGLETVSRPDFEVLVLVLPADVLVLVLVLRAQVLVLVSVLKVQVLVLVLVLRAQVSVLVLVLRVQVLVLSISKPRPRSGLHVHKYYSNMPELTTYKYHT